jgi:hypothetical protein
MPTIHEQLEDDRKRSQPEAPKVKDFRNYARGKQRSTLTPYQRHIMRGLFGHTFCDNICKKVLSEIRNRLKLARFDVADDAVLQFLHDFWIKNKLPRVASSVHWSALRDGNTAIGLQWTDRVIMTRERWWNGKYGFFMAYNDDDEPTYAVRDWKTPNGDFRTVWFPDHIERYKQNGNGWAKRTIEGDPPTGWPQWLDKSGQPLGIPFVHFANLQVPNDGTGDDSSDEPDSHYGLSELDGGMLGLQDEVNDVHRDLTAGARYAGFPMMYGTGITSPKSPDGSSASLKFKPEPGAFFSDTNKDAKIGMIQPGSLSELERTITVKLQAVSRLSGIPMHVISGDWPSGEALLRSEMPLIDKVESIGTSFGPAWSTTAYKAVRIQNTFAQESNLDDSKLIQAVFESASKRDPLTQAIVAEKRAPFVSVKETLRTLGYSDQQADKIITEMLGEVSRGVPRPNLGTGKTATTRPTEAGADKTSSN